MDDMVLEMVEYVLMLMSKTCIFSDLDKKNKKNKKKKNMHGQEMTLAHLTIAWLEVEMRYAQKLILRKTISSPQKISLSNE